MKNPRASILLPTYRRPVLIQRALASIYEQDFEDWELIVIENGSTPVIHEQYMDEVVAKLPKDLKITWLTAPWASLPRALNLGFEKSKGQYISVQEDDDEWFPAFLDSMHDHMNNHFCGMAYCRQMEIENGKPVTKGTPIPPRFNPQALLRGDWIGFPTVMFRREALESIGGFNELAGPATGWISWCSIMRSWLICDVRKILAIHHWHTDEKDEEVANYCIADTSLHYTILQRRMLARGEFGPWDSGQRT